MILKDIVMMTFYYMTFGDQKVHGKNIKKKVKLVSMELKELKMKKHVQSLEEFMHGFILFNGNQC